MKNTIKALSILIIILGIGFVAGYFSCSWSNDLTKTSQAAKKTDGLASVSSMYAVCMDRNVGVNQTSGANLRNCDKLGKLYRDVIVNIICAPVKNVADKKACYIHFK